MCGLRMLSAAGLLILAACSRPDAVANGIATDAGIAAIALPEEQYREMLKRSTLATQSAAMFLGILGMDKGCDVFDAAVEKTVDENLPQWRSNLVAAYRDNVPPSQLAEAVQESPPRAQSMLQENLPAIGASMQAKSTDLLKSSSVEVLASLSDAASKVDRASIDWKDRERDLAEIKASGQICGVGK
jgi:hypothetical protein